jgi:transposase-like protein
MANLIRNQLMEQDDDQLAGEVEMDETYVGGQPRLKDRVRKPDGSFQKGKVGKKKTTVFGAVERAGKVRAEVIPSTERGGIARRVETFVLPSSVVYTDEYVGYNKPGQRFQAHHRINHQAKVYVRGNVHTQTIEGFWALFKGGLIGTYHGVSEKWLQGYLNEFAWRYNHRSDRKPLFKSLLENASRRVEGPSLAAS